jgi:hypothetical protein
VGSTVINANRRFLALADDAKDAAATLNATGGTAAESGAGTTPAAGAARTDRSTYGAAASSTTEASGRTTAASSRRRGSAASAGHAWLIGTRGQRLELAVLRHRILVLLAEVSTLNQCVDAGRVLIPVLPVEQIDRAGVLFPAEGQFGLFLSLRLLTPRWQEGAHHDRHHGHAHQQRRHRISALACLTL